MGFDRKTDALTVTPNVTNVIQLTGTVALKTYFSCIMNAFIRTKMQTQVKTTNIKKHTQKLKKIQKYKIGDPKLTLWLHKSHQNVHRYEDRIIHLVRQLKSPL